MGRQRKEPAVRVQVAFLDDPENARAAEELLKQGFRRAYLKLLVEQQQRIEEANAAGHG